MWVISWSKEMLKIQAIFFTKISMLYLGNFWKIKLSIKLVMSIWAIDMLSILIGRIQLNNNQPDQVGKKF